VVVVVTTNLVTVLSVTYNLQMNLEDVNLYDLKLGSVPMPIDSMILVLIPALIQEDQSSIDNFHGFNLLDIIAN